MNRYCLLSLVALAGCASPPETIMPSFNPAGAAAKAISLFDANKNGTLEGPELEKSPGLKAALALIDTNHDQALSAAEIEARVRAYAKSSVAMYPVHITVKIDRIPLDGANVTLVPEPFLEPPLKRISGITDRLGIVTPKLEGMSLAEVNIGLYRVEITYKNPQGQDLPAKYNTETTLGLEVALDTPSLERGVTFDLSSR